MSTTRVSTIIGRDRKPNHIFRLVTLLIITMLGLVPCASAGYETTITVPMTNPDYAELFAEFDEVYLNGNGAGLDDNTTGTLAWVASYHMLGYMRQYKATKQTHWLDRLVTQFDRILKKRDDRLGRKDVHTSTALKGWGTATYDKAGWHVFIVHTGMICQGAAGFVREVKSDPALQPAYGATADRYLAELMEIVAEAEKLYWKENAQTGEGYYTDPTMGVMPLNMVSAMAVIDLELYHITGKEKYRDKVEKFATFFRNCLRDNGEGGYNWSYWPKTSKDPVKQGEDISHAALNVDFAARCAAAGIVFTPADITKFARTWLEKVRQGDGKWAMRVDGQGKADKAYLPQAPGRWLSLMPLLPKPLAGEFYKNVASAFAGQTVTLPSRALGIANLALYGP